MKWVKTYTLVAAIAAFAVAQIPQDVFGVADATQKTAFIDSVCTKPSLFNPTNGGDLFNDSLFANQSNMTDDQISGYCKAYLRAYLKSTTVTTEDADPDSYGTPSNNQVNRIQTHVRWWANASNQGDRIGNSDAWSFLKEYCYLGDALVSGTELYGFGTVTDSTLVRPFDCVYDDGSKMQNPYCYYFEGWEWVSGATSASNETTFLQCYTTSQARDSAGKEAGGEGTTGSGSEGDDCSQGSSLGWIFCPLANTVSDLIDGMIDWFLVPMLQWRILIP